MKDGICPKCGAKEIHIVDGNRTGISISLSWSRNTFANLYVCVKCGYIEMFVEDEEDLPRIAERWRKFE